MMLHIAPSNDFITTSFSLSRLLLAFFTLPSLTKTDFKTRQSNLGHAFTSVVFDEQTPDAAIMYF